jgi:hypothetical protein
LLWSRRPDICNGGRSTCYECDKWGGRAGPVAPWGVTPQAPTPDTHSVILNTSRIGGVEGKFRALTSEQLSVSSHLQCLRRVSNPSLPARSSSLHWPVGKTRGEFGLVADERVPTLCRMGMKWEPAQSNTWKLCLTKYHAVNKYWGSGGVKLGNTWRWDASFTLRPLYPRYPLYRRLGGSEIRSGCGSEEEKSLSLQGTEIRSSSPWLSPDVIRRTLVPLNLLCAQGQRSFCKFCGKIRTSWASFA